MLTLPGTPLPWKMHNADLSRDENTHVQVNEIYTVTCKRGHEIYNQHSDSFVGGQDGRLRSVTVKNVQGHLSITDTNLNSLMDRLVCKAGAFS